MKKRALRRHHIQRRKMAEYKKWKRIFIDDKEQAWDHATRFHHTRTICSCSGCGNPRRYEKGKERLTLQERKAPDINET